MQIQIKVTSSGDGLAQLEAKLKDAHKALVECGRYMKKETRNNFSSQTDPDGAAWAPLRPGTLKSKRGGRILTRSGALRNSIRVKTSGLTTVVSVGTDYAVYHQNGTSKMTARKIIGIGAKHEAEIKQIFEKHLGG